MCDVWQLSDVVMCTSSIMHMCTISLDRYSAIRDPLRSRAARGRSPLTFWAKICAVWLTSVVIGSPLIVVGVLSPGELLSDDGQCAIVNAYFLVYGSLAAFFGPLSIMLVTFVLTVRLLEREATQLAANGNEGMRRCTADRKACPPTTIVTRTAGATAEVGVGRRRRMTRSSWMSRFSRSEAPTTTSMLPSPNKFPHEIELPNTTSGPDVGETLHLTVRKASRDTSRDEVAVSGTATAVTSSMTACCDRLRSAEVGSCMADVSTSVCAPYAATNSISDDVTNVASSGSASGCRTDAQSGDISRLPEATSVSDVTCVTSSRGKATADDTGASDCCRDVRQQNSTTLVKSVSEFSSLRLPEVVLQRRSVAVTSLDSSGVVADRLRRVIVSLHPGHVDSERHCLLKHSDDRRRYVADHDVIKLSPAEPVLADTSRRAFDQHHAAPRISGPATQDAVIRRSRSDSVMGIQRLACCRGHVIQLRDPTAPTNIVAEGGPTNDVTTDAQRPLAAAVITTKMAATGDAIVADDDNGAGNLGQGEMTKSTSGADKFKGLVRKHGAAFQVAGMLRATREDRQQKAFSSVKTESKAVKVLGTMFAIFVTCWAPFFTANFIMGICSSCYVDPLLFKV